ncbi:MAG: helix-turn-helix domain-containing protein [Streptomyces sp.]|nr:helix-turn-helix domain-containing protein [Streptomyces sp.]
MTDKETAPSAEPFIAELKRWRDVRGLSQSALAEKVGYTPSYVSKVENSRQSPSREFAEAADRVLLAGGSIRRAFSDYETQRQTAGSHGQRHTPDVSNDAQGTSLIVEHEDSDLYYDGHLYRATQRRQIFNASQDPITRYLIRISVDRYPGNPERSNRHYREHPLTWEEIGLTASVNGEPIGWKVQHDRDAFKEVWLTFDNEHGRYPVYPGETARLEYSYTVADTKWGTWFQRAVRLPTHRLSVRLDFPAELDPIVWGTETTMTAEAFPFRTAIQQDTTNERRVFAWSVDDPPLHARYRLEWKFRARRDQEGADDPMPAVSVSETMRSLGVVQEGDAILSQTARPFDLPEEAEDARRIVAELNSASERIASVHVFGKGMGVAAPQLGIDRAAAIVKTPDGEVVTLLNPRIVDESPQSDEQYEGCLSFFDVRGMVPRPLRIEVEHQDIDGCRRITVFENGMARLIAHEVDHLFGMLYKARMHPGVTPIPIAEYRGTGQRWQYEEGETSGA